MEEDIQDIQDAYNFECKNMEENIIQNTNEEENKFQDIQQDLISLKEKMGEDIQKRLIDMEKLKMDRDNKNKETLNLYNKEINRLKEDLLQIRKNMEDAYNNEAITQGKVQ